MDSSNVRLLLYLSLFIFGGALYSILVSYFTKNVFLRYLPTFISALFILYFLYLIYFTELEGFLSLAYLIFIFTATAVILGNVTSNLVLGFKKKRSRK